MGKRHNFTCFAVHFNQQFSDMWRRRSGGDEEGAGTTFVCVNRAPHEYYCRTVTATSSRGSYSDHCHGTGNELQTFQYGLAAGCHTDTDICGCLVRLRLSGD